MIHLEKKCKALGETPPVRFLLAVFGPVLTFSILPRNERFIKQWLRRAPFTCGVRASRDPRWLPNRRRVLSDPRGNAAEVRRGPEGPGAQQTRARRVAWDLLAGFGSLGEVGAGRGDRYREQTQTLPGYGGASSGRGVRPPNSQPFLLSVGCDQKVASRENAGWRRLWDGKGGIPARDPPYHATPAPFVLSVAFGRSLVGTGG